MFENTEEGVHGWSVPGKGNNKITLNRNIRTSLYVETLDHRTGPNV